MIKPTQPWHSEVLEDCFYVGGVALTRLAQRVGRTPFYAYDRRRIMERVALRRDARCLSWMLLR